MKNRVNCCKDRFASDIRDIELEEQTDEFLMEHFYHGDVKDSVSIGILWIRHADYLIYYALNCLPKGLVARLQTAQDCVTNSLIRVLRTKTNPLSRWNSKQGLVFPWIRKIVKNQTIDHLRKQQREPALECDLQTDGGNLLAMVVTDHRIATAAAAVKKEQQRKLLWQMVAQLPEELGTIVTLKYRDDLKHREIGKRLGYSDATISRRLQAAKQELHRLAETGQIAV